ncbi:MAG: Gram-negative bacterial tonB protein [Chitinophagaceae bacterium]|nr:Gram-negative bacterial tonB protein [Chitinophagaceae bacterium]
MGYRHFLMLLFLLTLGVSATQAQGFVVDSARYGPDTVYTSPDETAIFPGGKEQLVNYIDLKFDNRSDGYGGMGGVKGGSIDALFIVEANGKVKYAFIEQGSSAAHDEEMMRALLTSPKWQPALVNGKKVRSLQKLHYNLNFSR